PYKNELYRVLHSNISWSHNHWAFRRLMENDDYKRYFINRSADMFNTMLLPSNIIHNIHTFKNRLSPEMDRHMTRWESSFGEWEANVNEVFEFVEDRLGYVWQHYIDEFDLDTLVTIGLDVDSIIHGTIKINTIIPDSLPWNGIYFDGNPVEISAIADSGYLFSHWSANHSLSGIDTLNPQLNLNVDTNDFFKAFFVIDTIVPDTPLVVFNEINYRSIDTLDADDWVELWNVDTISIDLSAWVFKDGNDDHEFVIPSQIIIDTGQFLVLSQDTGKFKSIYTDIQNVIGPFEFGLVNEGEELRLFDNTGMLVVSMLYSNQEPWPTDADGTGKTIELFDPYGVLNDGNNWFSGCIGGSPGGPFQECDTVGIYSIKDPVSNFKVYPNPFSAVATFEFYLDSEEEIIIEVYNPVGNLTFKKQIYYADQGIKRFTINRSDMESGVYFYKVHFKDIIQTGKLLVR
ncbi:MAG: lamin tail domain-containing protein, partial [Bacteroidales bacterium]|nr:lamin tail domain-containing protein [Bacteroidales bacterium]